MNTDSAPSKTPRRSFLAALAAGTAGILAFPFRFGRRPLLPDPAAAGKPPVVRPHPDAVPRTTRGSSSHG